VAEGDRAARVAAGGVRRSTIAIWQVAVGASALALWEALVSVRLLDPFFVSQPTEIARRVAAWSGDGTIWLHLATTLEESLLGLLIGSALGIALGFWFGRSPALAMVFDPYIKMLNAVPRIVLAPLFLLWFGLGIWSKVALAVTLVFFIMFFSTYQGVRDADRVLVDNVRMLGASQRQLVRHVLVPSALTWIFSSLQASLGFAMVGAVVGEYLGSTRGLGYVISQAEGTFDTTGVFAGMTVLAIVVVLVSAAVSRLERWLLEWKQ
jgi:NitT/TauT family transport system permease protein